jgi:hypothetical protein
MRKIFRNKELAIAFEGQRLATGEAAGLSKS